VGSTVQFASNGSQAEGYLAVPASGSGPGVLVIQEWWGLVPHIRDVCDRFAAAGFVALAPDLYHGASTTEPDEAGKLMMGLNIDGAARDMSGAVDFLLGLDATTGDGVGVVGFCMGGGLALVVATRRPDAVRAVAPFYGLIPWESAQPDFSQLTATVRGQYAGDDEYFPPAAARALEQQLRDLGKDVAITVHPGTHHAFFNDDRPEVHDPAASAAAWDATLELFRATL
jgi:carboxymethylenebutenolidase